MNDHFENGCQMALLNKLSLVQELIEQLVKLERTVESQVQKT
jgi:hypothetical protein